MTPERLGIDMPGPETKGVCEGSGAEGVRVGDIAPRYDDSSIYPAAINAATASAASRCMLGKT
jgi:hypothetical protein